MALVLCATLASLALVSRVTLASLVLASGATLARLVLASGATLASLVLATPLTSLLRVLLFVPPTLAGLILRVLGRCPALAVLRDDLAPIHVGNHRTSPAT